MLWCGGKGINGQTFGKMWRDGVVQCGFQQRKARMKPPAERQPQRGIVGFYQGFGEAGAVVGKDGEIRGGIEGDGQQIE